MLLISIWIFQEIILSEYTPRNFEALFSFVLFCISFLFLVELNKEYFVLEIFQNSLLALCQVATFCSSSSIILKTFSLSVSQVNKIVSYANNWSSTPNRVNNIYEEQKWSKDRALLWTDMCYSICYFRVYRIMQTVVYILNKF